jgi:hypothetical protein
MAVRDLVLLLPGFFGFTRLSGFYYFAERSAAAIRGGLDVQERRPIPVVPLSTLPAASLRERQDALLSQIRVLDHKLGATPRLHLVGHSAGGIDAYLLTCERRVTGEPWTSADDALRRRIASVTTIATPFHGTWLSVASAARFALDPRHNAQGLVSAWKLAASLIDLPLEKALVWNAAANALTALPDATKFCWHLIRHRQLIGDLAPDPMETLLRGNRRVHDAQITNFVTVVPEERVGDAAPFFRDLYALTAGDNTRPISAVVKAAVGRLNAHAAEAMRPDGTEAPVFDARISDGVVNSARQLIEPHDRSTLGGIIVADHVDVLGYYDGVDSLVSGRALNESVFRSGAGFCDDLFFELYRRVAESILGVMNVSYRKAAT